MHRLYLLLRDCLPEHEERYLIDEIGQMVERMKNSNVLIRAIDILYPNKKVDYGNPLELLLLFIRGLKQNEFFEYATFINGIRSGKRRS